MKSKTYFHSLLLVVVLLKTVVGCGRKEATPAPPSTTTTPVPPLVIVDSVDILGNKSVKNFSAEPTKSHKLPCPPSKAHYCLNGGTCFLLDLNHAEELSCHCPQMRTGLRCEEEIIIFVSPVPYAAETGLIAMGIILFIVVVLGLLGFYVYKRYRKKETARKAWDADAAENGHEMIPMNKDVENGNVDYSSHNVVINHDNDPLPTEKPTEL